MDGVVMKSIQLMQCDGLMNSFMYHALLEGYKFSSKSSHFLVSAIDWLCNKNIMITISSFRMKEC